MPGLDARVIVTMARSTEAGRHVVCASAGVIGGTGLRTAAIGVVQHPAGRLLAVHRLSQRPEDAICGHAGAHSPADNQHNHPSAVQPSGMSAIHTG
jgi:hypothetical protein